LSREQPLSPYTASAVAVTGEKTVETIEATVGMIAEIVAEDGRRGVGRSAHTPRPIPRR